jgi:hypothetical protein
MPMDRCAATLSVRNGSSPRCRPSSDGSVYDATDRIRAMPGRRDSTTALPASP